MKRNFVLFGGALGWLLQLLFAYAIAEFGCLSGWGDERFLTLSYVACAQILLAVFALGLAYGAHEMARHRLQMASSSGAAKVVNSSTRFLEHSSLIMNRWFLFIILVQTVPILYYLHGC